MAPSRARSSALRKPKNPERSRADILAQRPPNLLRGDLVALAWMRLPGRRELRKP